MFYKRFTTPSSVPSNKAKAWPENRKSKRVISMEDLADSTSYQELLEKLVEGDPLEEFEFEEEL